MSEDATAVSVNKLYVKSKLNLLFKLSYLTSIKFRPNLGLS